MLGGFKVMADNGNTCRVVTGEDADKGYDSLRAQGFRPAIQFWLKPTSMGYEVYLSSEVDLETTVNLVAEGLHYLTDTEPQN